MVPDQQGSMIYKQHWIFRTKRDGWGCSYQSSGRPDDLLNSLILCSKDRPVFAVYFLNKWPSTILCHSLDTSWAVYFQNFRPFLLIRQWVDSIHFGPSLKWTVLDDSVRFMWLKVDGPMVLNWAVGGSKRLKVDVHVLTDPFQFWLRRFFIRVTVSSELSLDLLFHLN